MYLPLDPLITTILIAGGIFAVSYYLGRWSRDAEHEEVVEHTIKHLINEGYIKTRRLSDGELELLPYDSAEN